MKLSRIIIVAASLSVTGACVSFNMKEDTPSLSSEQCVLPADVEIGNVKAEVSVSSNQSWVANIKGVCRWAVISNNEHINPSSVTDNDSFTVELENNETFESRSFEVIITGKDLTRTVTVTQQAKKNRIRIVEPLNQILSAEPGVQKISVLSNTGWTAIVDSSLCSISRKQGYGDADLELTISPNYSKNSFRVVNVLFAGEDVDTVRMTYSLEKNVPFVRVDKSYQNISLLPIDTTLVIPFLVNDGWKAQIIKTDFVDLALDPLAGKPGENTCSLKFGKNRSEAVRTAMIRISLDNTPDVYFDINLTQRKGIALFLDFSKGVSKVPLLPASPSDPPMKDHTTDGLPHNYVFTFDGVEYYFTLQFPVEYYYYISGKSFYSRKGYFLLPAIEGKRLVEVQILPGSGKRYSVCEDSAGTVYLDGGMIYTTTAGVTAKWVLKNTTESASYFLCFHDNGMQTKTFTFIYE